MNAGLKPSLPKVVTMNVARVVCLLFVCCPAAMEVVAQAPAAQSPPSSASSTLPDAPQTRLPAKPLQQRPELSPEDAAEALRISKLARINGEPYDQPSTHDTLVDYAKDTYGVPGLVGTGLRAMYAEIRQKPESWNFGDRLGSAEGITLINGNVRLGMELIFREDLRYLPCNGCSFRKKLENVLLAEVTARHDEDGHRFFTLTPTVADFSGPIIAHSIWYPGAADPLQGVVSARTVFAARIAQRLAIEIFRDPMKKTKKSDNQASPKPRTQP
jgi:hypothetical protein